jgi:hypothetical protein
MKTYSFNLDDEDELLFETVRSALLFREHRRTSVRDVVVEGLLLLKPALSQTLHFIRAHPDELSSIIEDLPTRSPPRPLDEDSNPIDPPTEEELEEAAHRQELINRAIAKKKTRKKA